jgi:hypothetical protein
MKRPAIIASLLSLCIGSAAAGSFDTGNDILRTCTDPATLNGCRTFLAGIAAAMNVQRHAETGKDCTPPGAKVEQARDVVVRFLQSNPEFRHINGPIQAIMAIEQAWCPSGDSPTVSRIPEQQPKWKDAPAALPVKKPLPVPIDTE